MHIISGYKFIELSSLEERRNIFLERCTELSLKGTILLSTEGININLCGSEINIAQIKKFLKEDSCFADISFRESVAQAEIFKRLKVKIKAEIITFRVKHVSPTTKNKAPSIAPQELKQWLDEDRDFILLDTRNVYEIECGTFKKAVDLRLNHFCDFPLASKITNLPKDKTVVMFCTGGIRCEKAALYMQKTGHQKVYQLQGGILNYFAKVGNAHYTGDCFVFDERGRVEG